MNFQVGIIKLKVQIKDFLKESKLLKNNNFIQILLIKIFLIKEKIKVNLKNLIHYLISIKNYL